MWLDPKERRAPAGKFRLTVSDTFDHEEYIIDDYIDKKAAIAEAGKRGGTMNLADVYDDQGKRVFRAGTF